MSHSVYCPHGKHVELPCVHRLEGGAVATWLAAGWHDFRRTWPASLAYGAVFGALALAGLYYTAGQRYLSMALAGGYLLLAPVLAAAIYPITRRLEWQDTGQTGTRPSLGNLFNSQAALFGLILVVVFAIWINLAMITTAAFAVPEPAEAGALALFGPAYLPFLLTYSAIGTLMALAVFVASAVTLPMLMDRQTDLITAVLTSWVVVKENPAALAAWAAAIALAMLVGMLSLFIGFAVLFPVLCHAGWHAYRELVERG